MSSDVDGQLDELDARPGPSDAELIAGVRGGDTAAFAELYQRHSVAAYGLARQLASSPSAADDLVAEAFAKVLEALRGGRGPDSAFRAYLLTTLRHGLYDNSRRDRRLQFSDDLTAVDPGTPFVDTPIRDLEASLVARAYAALPERWQTVLWHTEIEGQKPADVAPLLGLTANGAAALAYRAREGLRQAYLQAHLAESAEDDCRFTVERLGAWARGGLAKREKAKVQDHLDTCARCRLLSGELVDVNSGLRAIIAPLVLGAPFVAGYLASLQVGAGAAGGASLAAAGASPAPGGSMGGESVGGESVGGASAGGTGGGSAGAAGATGATGATVAGSGARRAMLGGVVAVAVIALAGGGYALSRSNEPAGAPSSAGASDAARPGSTPSPSASAPSFAPSTSPASSAPASTSPASSAPASTEPASTAPSTAAPSTAPTGPSPTPTSPETPPARAPLSVSVSMAVNGAGMGESGTLSGPVGPSPQIRLLTALPAGWSVRISGPCLEGAGAATTVCTLTGAQGATSIVVDFLPPQSATDDPSITIGLFADPGDAVPIDSF